MWLWPLDDDWNAIELLSGDHAGCDEPDTPVVEIVVTVPAEADGILAIAPPCVNTIWLPSDDQLGSDPVWLSEISPVPSGDITWICPLEVRT